MPALQINAKDVSRKFQAPEFYDEKVFLGSQTQFPRLC